MSTRPYQILEVANTHGGNLQYLLDLIDEFKHHDAFGIKFQPLHPDKIATADYQWYPVYQTLFFNPEQWNTIIEKASATKEIWIDLFDTYGVEICNAHLTKVKGIKLQASVLYNESVVQALEKINLTQKVLIMNISGLELAAIQERIAQFQLRLQPAEIWIEAGFQSYPTALADSGLIKIATLKQHFDNPIVFADHAAGTSEDATWLPITAAMHGADIIEKHIMHSTHETQYDHFSSMKIADYDLYIQRLNDYLDLKAQPFINDREKTYLANSVQIPIAAKDIRAGSLLQFGSDLSFKRSAMSGISSVELRNLQTQQQVLAIDKKAGEAFQKADFKKATIATVIACRLKSSRLPKKALLKIGNLSSVERCIESCLRFNKANHTILATSSLEDDAPLKEYTLLPSVIFHTGDPDDVIRRYLGITDLLKVDVVIRVTADMPYVSEEIVHHLLQSHFETGADYTAAKTASVGTAAEIINTSALHRIKEHFPNAQYSEYMTWYFQNNADHFKINLVDLPEALVRNYRLTVDYQEDLDLFNAIQQHLDEKKLPPTIYNIFDFLDAHPEVAALNSHLTLRYKTDAALIETLNRETRIQ
ncbi:MAG: cytidylyltransferase domain-containing protein [Ferruginibacter sp.]